MSILVRDSRFKRNANHAQVLRDLQSLIPGESLDLRL